MEAVSMDLIEVQWSIGNVITCNSRSGLEYIIKITNEWFKEVAEARENGEHIFLGFTEEEEKREIELNEIILKFATLKLSFFN
jgi:hypothetical protein